MNRKPSMLVIFLTVFIDLVGFGIVVPLTPVFGRHFGANGLLIGVIVASFSAMQFVFSPIWGRLSDRHGRRPILLVSTAGGALSYVLFALASGLQNPQTAIVMMILARSFAGVFGGNLTVAQAYIADITPPEHRSKKMGIIGMAFGFGLICGPAIGGFSLKYLGITGPGWVAAGICAANFLLAFRILAESRRPDSSPVAARPHIAQWQHTLSQPHVGLLVVIFFLSIFCFSVFESTLALLVCDNFGLDIRSDATTATTATWLFVYCGLIGAVVQGGMIGRIVKKHGEPKVIAASLVLTGISFAMMPFIKSGSSLPLSWRVLFESQGHAWWLMLLALAILSVGSSLTRAPLFGLLSNLTPDNEQGATIGVAQGAGSFARILGPIFATTTLVYYPPLPYLTGTAILFIIGIVAAVNLRGTGHVTRPSAGTVPPPRPQSADPVA